MIIDYKEPPMPTAEAEHGFNVRAELEKGREFRTAKHKYPVRIVCTDRQVGPPRIGGAPNQPILGLVTLPSGEETTRFWYEDGRCSSSGLHDYDLELVPVSIIRYRLMFKNSGEMPASHQYLTLKDAEQAQALKSFPSYWRIVKLEWEE